MSEMKPICPNCHSDNVGPRTWHSTCKRCRGSGRASGVDLFERTMDDVGCHDCNGSGLDDSVVHEGFICFQCDWLEGFDEFMKGANS